jgi:hypothetical protein
MGDDSEASKENTQERNLGIQPLDALLTAHELSNHDVVAACPAPLTHKAVARARKGRVLTPQTQRRVLEAVNLCLVQRHPEETPVMTLDQLFNYDARQALAKLKSPSAV